VRVANPRSSDVLGTQKEERRERSLEFLSVVNVAAGDEVAKFYGFDLFRRQSGFLLVAFWHAEQRCVRGERLCRACSFFGRRCLTVLLLGGLVLVWFRAQIRFS